MTTSVLDELATIIQLFLMDRSDHEAFSLFPLGKAYDLNEGPEALSASYRIHWCMYWSELFLGLE